MRTVPNTRPKRRDELEYSRRIEDKEAAKKTKVGDKIDMTWTEAVQIAIIPGK